MTELPDGWTWATIGEVCEKPKYGWTTSASDNGEVKLLRTTDLTHGPITWETVPFCKETPKTVADYLVNPNDIFISRAGSVGVSVLVKDAPYKSVFASYLIRIRPTKKIDAKYLSLFLQSPHYWNQVTELSSGIALANINATKIQSMTLPLPPIDEQHKIVELLEDYLSRLDTALVDVKQARIKAAQFRRSILQSAFKRGVADEHDKSVWTTAQLSNLVDIGWGDLQVTKKSYVQKGFLAYSAAGADGFLPYFDYDSEGIIISAIGANCGKIFRANGKWSCIKNTMRILPKNPGVLIDYLFHYLSDSSIFPKRGSGQPFIGQQDAREIEISFPSIAEQKKIIEFVEYSISRLEASLKLAEEMEVQSIGLRRSLLQAAFTGQLTKGVASV